jgi:endonuclease/exonuclease/phosphatase family metal-dependent hydrolase
VPRFWATIVPARAGWHRSALFGETGRKDPDLTYTPARPRPWRALTTLFLLVALLVSLTAATSADAATPRPAKVMTRNIYLGADLTRAITATTVPQFLAANAQIFSNVQQTNFPERAKALAREIDDADPTLLGLQEAAIWYSGTFGSPAQATNVEYDFIATLRSELAAVGAPYDLVKVQKEADIEAPAAAPFFKDFRLVQQDAILVKAGLGSEVKLTNAQSANFVNRLTIPTGIGQQIPVDRGWVSVDAVVNKRAFRFVNTHLEAFHPLVRLQQAGELLAGPIGSAPGKVVLVGDINSGPDLPVPANRLAYQALVAGGMVDTWPVANPGDPGPTAGFSELLDDPSADVLDNRIDMVMTKGSVGVTSARIYGTDPDNRTAGGLWPSDHAGVAATLTP